MTTIIKIAIHFIKSFIKRIWFTIKKEELETDIKEKKEELKDVEEKASSDYDNFRKLYDEYKRKRGE